MISNNYFDILMIQQLSHSSKSPFAFVAPVNSVLYLKDLMLSSSVILSLKLAA